MDSNFTLQPDGKLEADKLEAEWFARVLATPAVRTAATAASAPDYFIRQEGTRRRAGK